MFVYGCKQLGVHQQHAKKINGRNTNSVREYKEHGGRSSVAYTSGSHLFWAMTHIITSKIMMPHVVIYNYYRLKVNSISVEKKV